MNPIEVMAAIAAGTMKECDHCNGYGSSFKEDAPICTRCGGVGAVPNAV
jgi:DnaJ-class molecular chaperone